MAEQTGTQSYVETVNGYVVPPPENGPPDVIASRQYVIDSRDRDRSKYPNPARFRVAFPNYAGVIRRVNVITLQAPIPQGVTEKYLVLRAPQLEPNLEAGQWQAPGQSVGPSGTAPVAGSFAVFPLGSVAAGDTYLFEQFGAPTKASVLGFEKSKLEVLDLALQVRGGPSDTALVDVPYADEPAPGPTSPTNNWLLVLEVVAHQ